MLSRQSLTIYDSWQISFPTVPSRSRLFYLEPIGVGTPLVEGLSSYVTRLAQSHSVLLGKLVDKELRSVIPKSYKSRELFGIKHRTGGINGTGTIASDLVGALSKLTLRRDLIYLTLLRWSEVFPQRQLIRPVKAWCPICYQEWHSQNKPIYEPLIWAIQPVIACLQHRIPLHTRCPHCSLEIPHLSSNSRLGYCSHCEKWLGQQGLRLSLPLSNESWELWVINNLGELLAADLSSLEAVFTKERLSESLMTAIREVSQGNIAAFARLIGLPKNQVWMWARGQVLPQLSTLLRICYFLKLSLLDFYASENPKISHRTSIKLISRDFNNLKAKKTNLIQLEQSLKLFLQEKKDKPSSLNAIAQQLAVNRRTLTRSFPDLCKAISTNYLEYRRTTRIEKIRQCALEIDHVVSELANKGIYPSESNVSLLMAQPGYLRYQEVRTALKEARQKLGING